MARLLKKRVVLSSSDEDDEGEAGAAVAGTAGAAAAANVQASEQLQTQPPSPLKREQLPPQSPSPLRRYRISGQIDAITFSRRAVSRCQGMNQL